VINNDSVINKFSIRLPVIYPNIYFAYAAHRKATQIAGDTRNEILAKFAIGYYRFGRFANLLLMNADIFRYGGTIH